MFFMVKLMLPNLNNQVVKYLLLLSSKNISDPGLGLWLYYYMSQELKAGTEAAVIYYT